MTIKIGNSILETIFHSIINTDDESVKKFTVGAQIKSGVTIKELSSLNVKEGT